MKKTFHHVMSVIIVLVLLFSHSFPSLAFTREKVNLNNLHSRTDLLKLNQQMNNLSINELESIIDQAKVNSENRVIGSIVTLKAAWLAAAKIARKKGYPLSASLVEHSVLMQNYNEKNGQFSKKIRNTSIYKRLLQSRAGSSAFTKSIDKDLFYSIHKFDYTVSGTKYRKQIIISDTFDFKWESDYDNVFTTSVNNWACLNQAKWVLYPIKVRIQING